MNFLVYFLLATLILLGVCLLLLRRGRLLDFDRETHGIGHEALGSVGWNYLTSELSARIFDPEDLDFVASETSRHVTRQFRQERTSLALEWLRAMRGQVNQFMRAHLRASRANDDLKAADELRVWFEFLLFHLTGGVLYFVVWICGPPRAARLVGYSLNLAGELRHVIEDVLPAGRQVAAQLMNSKHEPKNGDVVG